MGLSYNAFDDDDDELDAYELSQEMAPSKRTGARTDPTKLKEEPGFSQAHQQPFSAG